MKRVQACRQIPDHRIELFLRDVHAGVQGEHIDAGVSLWTPGDLAHLLDKLFPEPRYVEGFETVLDYRVLLETPDEIIDHRRDRGKPAQTLVERNGLCLGRRRVERGRGRAADTERQRQ